MEKFVDSNISPDSNQPLYDHFKNRLRLSSSYLGRLTPVFLLSLAMLLTAFLWLFGPALSLRASGYHFVATNGSNSVNCSDSAPCQTIQYAIDNAAPGDEIRVAAGTYTEIITINKNITLRGGFTTTNWLTPPDPGQNPTIIDANGVGRTIYVSSGVTAKVIGFHITGGSGSCNGGGIYNQGSLTLEDNKIYQNAVTAIDDDDTCDGGGGVATVGISLTLRSNQIYSNTSLGSTIQGQRGDGGGLNIRSGAATLEENEIFNNSSRRWGGGITIGSNIGGEIKLRSNLIYSNTTTHDTGYGGGGGIFVNENNTARMENNTLYKNTSARDGGSIFLYDQDGNNSDITIINNLIISNTAASASGGIHNDGASLNVSYTDFFGNAPTNGYTTGTNNRTDQYPQFVDPANFDLHLSSGSGAINTGAITTSASTDFEGQARPYGSGIDRGGDEYMPASSCYARLNDGQVYDDLQYAVNIAEVDDTIKVAGQCTGSGLQVLYISKTVILQGGYAPDNWRDRTAKTILDGGNTRRVVYITGDHDVIPTLDGFYITNGAHIQGAGIFIEDTAGPVIQNNAIYNNNASGPSGNGGGIHTENGDPMLRHNTFYDNSAGGDGGGIYNENGQPVIVNNLFINNTGAAIHNESDNTLIIRHNDFWGNTTGDSALANGPSNNLSLDPQFANASGGNFHLKKTSPVLGQADPNTAYAPYPNQDFEGDIRPQGLQSDMGADEALVFPALELTPPTSRQTKADDDQAAVVTHTHTLYNRGSIQETFNITYAHPSTWTILVQPSGPITLAAGAQQTINVYVTIPDSASQGMQATTVITAQSQTNPYIYAVATDTSRVRLTPAATFEPNYTSVESILINPGETITIYHTLTNDAPGKDRYVLTFDDSAFHPDNTEIEVSLRPSDPYTVPLAANGDIGDSIQIPVVITMPAYAGPASEGSDKNLKNFHITAHSLEPDTDYTVMVTDTAKATAISGDRYVNAKPPGNDDIDSYMTNNCRVPERPCETVQYGVGMVFGGGTVHVARGTYQEQAIEINGNITLQGGWNAAFDTRTIDPSITVIDAGANDARAMQVMAGNTTIDGFTIKGGRAGNTSRGGGILLAGGGLKLIQNNQFIDNRAQYGGAIAVNVGQPTFKNNVFYNNHATNNGGGLYIASNSATLINNTLVDNSAGNQGGGIYNNLGSISILNTNVSSSTAGTSGGGFYNNGVSVTMNYNNFYANTAPSDPDRYGASAGPNSIAEYPLFSPPITSSTPGLESLYFQLPPNSPLVDVGDPNTDNPTDYQRDLRPSDQGFDIGADELAGCVARIREAPSTIYGVIQDAVDDATEGQTVEVGGYCRGVHPLTIGGQVVYQSIHLTKTVHLAQYPGASSPPIVDAQTMGRTLFITGNIHPTIRDFTLINGNAANLGGGPGAADDAGGAIYIYDGAPIFHNMVISGNTAYLGGGVYNHLGSPTFSGQTDPVEDPYPINIIQKNTAAQNGGGFYNYQGQLHIDATHIFTNTAQNGAGIYNHSQALSLLFNANHVRGNEADINGGGFYNAAATPVTVTNVAIYSNTAHGNGGALYIETGAPHLWHITAVGNRADSSGGAVYIQNGAASISNTIVFRNNAAQTGGIYVNAGSTSVNYSDVAQNTGGNYGGVLGDQTGLNGNISEDPLFEDAKYHLTDQSPAKDTADPNSSVDRDYEWHPRPGDQGFDMGADELVGCVAGVDPLHIYGSVQYAIDAAIAESNFGATIRVHGHCRGVHPLTIGGLGTISQTIHLTTNLNLQGGWDETLSGRDGSITILNAQERGHVIYLGPGINSTIEAFDIINGVDGAIFNNASGGVILKQNNIYSNTSETSTYGAAIHNYSGSMMIEGGNRIHNNTAINGAALYVENGEPTLQNNFIYDDLATQGAGVYVANGSPNIWHNTFISNTVRTGGSGTGVYRSGGAPDIRSNIIMAGQGGTAMQGGVGGGYADYNNLVENDSNGDMNGSHDISATPHFLDRNAYDFHLEPDSADIDRGDPYLYNRSLTPTVATDFEGDIRPSHAGMDIGADEIPGCYVRNYTRDPGAIYGSPQYVVDFANPYDIVDIAGECLGTSPRGGHNQSLYISKTLTLRGGWDTGFGNRTGITTLDADGKGRVFYLSGSITGTIDRFRLTGVNINDNGGAIYNLDTGYLLQNNLIYSNTAQLGGGIYNADGSLTLWHNTFYNNTANSVGGGGGGLYVAGGTPVITNNLFAYSQADNGSAIYSNIGDLTEGYNAAWPGPEAQEFGNFTVAHTDMISNPLFMSENALNSEGPDPLFLKLGTGSEIIDKGDPNSPVKDDMNNDPRPIDLGFDPGADEYASCLARVTDHKGTRIYGRIQDAVDSVDSQIIGGSAVIDVAGHCRLIEGQNLIEADGDRNITFNGGWDTDFVNHNLTEYETILDGRDIGRILRVYSGTTVIVSDGFTFQSGAADNGGAIYNENGADLTIAGSVNIFANTATANGGGIYNAGTLKLHTLKEDDVLLVWFNHADYGGGIYNTVDGDLEMWSNRNQIYIPPYMLIAVSANSADNDGGGIYNAALPTTLIQSDAILKISGNSAVGNGGGIYNAGTDMDLFDPWGMLIDYNTASAGGGVYNANGSNLFVHGVDSISENEAQSGSGGGIYNEGELEIRNHGNHNNTAAQQGGGLYSNAANDLLLTNVYFFANEANGNGGGIYSSHGQTSLLHNTLRNNKSNGSGGGIYDNSPTLFINGTIVMSNSASSGGAGVHSATADDSDFTHNDFYHNALFGGTPAHSNVNTGVNDYFVDPEFLNGSTFVIDVESPVIDLGADDSGIDFYTPDGLDFDIGGLWWERPGTHRTKTYLGIGTHNDLGVHEVKIDYALEFCHFDLPCKDRTKEIDVDPGQTAIFTHTLQNTGDLTDTFSIVFTTTSGLAQLMTPDTITLPSFAHTTVVMSVTVPPGTPPWPAWDHTEIVARSENSLDTSTSAYVVYETLYDITNVNLVVGFEIAPPYDTSAMPNQLLTFEHIVTNTGNASDTITLGIDPPNYGETILYNDQGQAVNEYPVFLVAGKSKTFSVTYQAPGWLPPGSLEEFNVGGVSSSDPSVETSIPDKITILSAPGTRHVSPDGNDTDNNCTDIGAIQPPCRTLKHALAQSLPGDMIKISQGVFSTPMTTTLSGGQVITQILYLDSPVHIRGGYSDTNWDASQPLTQRTTLDAQGNSRVVYVTGTASITLDGLHITNGVGDGAGIYNNDADLTLLANAVYNNHTGSAADGAIYINGGSLTMRNNTVYQNDNSGVYINNNAQATVENNTFYGNSSNASTRSSENGGAIHHESGVLTATNNIFDNNQAHISGGAIYVAGGGGATAAIDTNLFYQNSSDVDGATPINSINEDPNLSDPDSGDFHLVKGHATIPTLPNPAEDVALDIGLSEDFERDIRPQGSQGTGYDLGADERLHIPGVEVAPDHTTLDAPFDTSIVYTNTVTNLGEDTDTFTITHSSSQGWADFSQLPTSVTLTAGQSQTIILTVTTGGSGSGGMTDITVITATSRNGFENAGMRVFDTAVNTTTVAQTHGLLFYPDRAKTVAPGELITYSHTLSNTGDGADIYNIQAVSSHGWTTDAPSPVTLPALSSTTVIVGLTIPVTAAGEVDTMQVTATSSNPAFSDAVTDTTTVSGTVVIRREVSLEPDNQQTVLANMIATYVHTLTNRGNVADTFSLTALSSQNWDVTITPAGPVTLPAGDNTEIEIQIVVPATATTTTVDLTVITATSTIDPSVSDTAANTTTITDAQTAALNLTPNHSDKGQPNTILTYQHDLTNLGNGNDTFTLTVASSQGWAALLSPASANLGPGETEAVTISVAIPSDAVIGSSDLSTVTAVSGYNPALSASAVNTTTVVTDTTGITRAVSLEPDNAKTVLADLTIYYTHTVSNLGNTADTFSLAASSNHGWPVNISPAGPLTLSAGNNADIQVGITIPSGVSTGVVDITTITATSTYSQAVFDTATNTTTITDVQTADLSLTPPYSSTVAGPGNSLNYQHTLRNLGNGNDTFSLSFVSSQAWGSLQPSGPLTLGPGQSSPITISVAIPADANDGVADVSVLTATSSVNSSIFATVVDTTTAHLEMIYLPIILKNYTPPTPTATATPTETATGVPPATDTPTATPVTPTTEPPTATPVTPTTEPPTATPVTPTTEPPIPGVDLIVTEIRIEPDPPTGGQPATVFVTIKNQGSANVPQDNNSYLDFYVDPTSPPSSSDGSDGIFYWDILWSDLGAGASKTYSKQYTFSSGSHTLYAQVDSYNLIPESNDANNILGPQGISVTSLGGLDTKVPIAPQATPRGTAQPQSQQ